MKIFTFILLTVPFFIGIFSDSLVNITSNAIFERKIKIFGHKVTTYIPDIYTIEESIQNGDITPSRMTIRQQERINQFQQNVLNGSPDYIRFIHFNSNFIPVIITQYQFNGDIFYYYQEIRDLKRNKKIIDDYCSKVEYLSKTSDGLFLTNCYNSAKPIKFSY